MDDHEKMAEFVKQEAGGESKLSWIILGLTLDEWKERSGCGENEYVLHDTPGTLLHTERGVFLTCMLGFMLVGRLQGDGSISHEMSMDGEFYPDKDVIISYCDPPFPGGCSRLPSGKIHCECELL